MASNKLAKVEQRLSARAKSAATERKIEKAETWHIGGGAVVGLVERFGWDIPSVPGLPDPLAYGALFTILGKSKGAGMSRNMRSLGIGMLTVGVRDLIAGKAKLGEAGDVSEIEI